MKPYFQDDAVTIYHGDCREIVPTLGRFDLLLTDPPYLLPGMKGAGCFGGRPSLSGTQGFTDMGFDSAILDAFDNWFCFCSRHNLREIIERAAAGHWALLHWCKPNPVPTCNKTYLSDVEYCVHHWTKGRLFGEMKDKSLFMVYPCGNKETTHPNEKPLALVGKLVRLGTQPGETILDPFAGSGTTGRAAKDLGRKAVLIEREERYCEIAARRMAQGVLDFTANNCIRDGADGNGCEPGLARTGGSYGEEGGIAGGGLGGGFLADGGGAGEAGSGTPGALPDAETMDGGGGWV